MLNNIVTLKSELKVTQDHSKWYHSKAWMQFPIRFPTMALSCIISETMVENRDFYTPCIRPPPR